MEAWLPERCWTGAPVVATLGLHPIFAFGYSRPVDWLVSVIPYRESTAVRHRGVVHEPCHTRPVDSSIRAIAERGDFT